MRNRNEGKGGSPATAGRSVAIALAAEEFNFDKKVLTATAGSAVTIRFNNKDSGIPHNFALYKNAGAADMIFQGDIITGPSRITYQFTAPSTPGKYFFRCDVHPAMMFGDFIVA